MKIFIGQSQKGLRGCEGRKEVEAIESRGNSSFSTFTTDPTQAPAGWPSPGGPWPLPLDSH